MYLRFSTSPHRADHATIPTSCSKFFLLSSSKVFLILVGAYDLYENLDSLFPTSKPAITQARLFFFYLLGSYHIQRIPSVSGPGTPTPWLLTCSKNNSLCSRCAAEIRRSSKCFSPPSGRPPSRYLRYTQYMYRSNRPGRLYSLV